MSGQPVSFDTSHPPHGHPDNVDASTQSSDKPATASHPPPTKPDPTVQDASERRLAPSTTASPTGKLHLPFIYPRNHQISHRKYQHVTHVPVAIMRIKFDANFVIKCIELARLKMNLRAALRQFPDFPSPGILFEDILPIFADPSLHESLIHALEIQILHSIAPNAKPGSDDTSQPSPPFPSQSFGSRAPSTPHNVDVIVGLEARGFLFGPSLALRLGAAFVPVRKKGKLPGPTKTASFKKEYGEDLFEIQADAIKSGQKVVVVDDIIATGGSAAAAGSLVEQLGATLLAYVFILELDFLKGRGQLDAPAYTLLASQEKGT